MKEQDEGTGSVAPHNHGRINFTKWGPIIAASIIGVASVTGSIVASLINRSGRTTTSTVPSDSIALGPIDSIALDPAAALTATSTTNTAPLVTAPPQVIIVQVPGSTIPGGAPNTVIVTVTVLVPAPTAPSTKGQPANEATSTLVNGATTSTSSTGSTLFASGPSTQPSASPLSGVSTPSTNQTTAAIASTSSTTVGGPTTTVG